MNHKRKGYTALVVMAVAALMSLTATMLWTSTNVEADVTANNYRISQARQAAHSGLSHFISLHLSDEDIDGQLLIPETQLSEKTAYEVRAVWVDDTRLMVMSTGRYMDGQEAVFEYPMRAVFTPEPGEQDGETEESD